MGSEGGIVGEGSGDVENTVYVAVGTNFRESRSILLWALQNCGGRKICILHVHQPAYLSALIDEKLSASKLKHRALKACRELERFKMHKLLTQYLIIVDHAAAGKMWIELESIEQGIVQLIEQRGIRWLVMGAASERHYSTEMSGLKSGKAVFVCQQAPSSCNIWFACKGCLVYTRSAKCIPDLENNGKMSSPMTAMERFPSQSHAEVDDKGANCLRLVEDSGRSTNIVVGSESSHPFLLDDIRGNGYSSLVLPRKSRDSSVCSSSVKLLEAVPEGESSCELRSRLEDALINAKNLKQKAFEESVRHWRADEDAMEALCKAEASESLRVKEMTLREEMERELTRQRQETENMKNQLVKLKEELTMVQDRRAMLESHFMKSYSMEKELEEKIIQAVNLLIIFKDKRDQMRAEREDAVSNIKEPRKLVGNDPMNFCNSNCMVSSFMDILQATQHFDPSRKIGESRYGSVYKGLFRHVKASILSRVRHPNIATLMGICPESRSLIYEYLENGSLEDCINCRGKNPPLQWQLRIKIAMEICSALVFLHSNHPPIIHGNLKLTNVLLDDNYACKLSEMGIHRLIPIKDPEVSVYMDPKFLHTGKVTTFSDIYSFGIILLWLVTGRPASGVVKDVKCALEKGNLEAVLDVSAGDWPIEQTTKLAWLGLRCCDSNPLNRPHLVDVLIVLQKLKDMHALSCVGSKTLRHVPSHFVCPIFKEVMKDPYISADGFTYEGDAIKGWLNGGHSTLPMTNLKLGNCDLLPNYALYYAIQDWMQQS